MKHFNITFEPDGRKISIHAGATVLEAANQAGIILNTACGGLGTCKKCVVQIEPHGRDVLACQHRIQGDLMVTIPQTSRFFEQKILTHGIDVKSQITIDAVDKTANIFGIAVDIGTTTVVAKLMDMSDGRCLATQAGLNPQMKYGDNCISRIAYAQTEENLLELQKLIIDCINDLTAKLCTDAEVKQDSIYQMTVVGNTTMNHIFLGIPVITLGQAPYRTFSLDARNIPPKQLGLQINPEGNIHAAANIAGFIGSDITAVALATDIDSAQEMTLIIDIGTNGEIVLGTAEKLYAASCAAGPAFEGARITHGSMAAAGAIESVVCNGDDIDLDVIGDCVPCSICGSGLIDAVAVLLDLGIVDSTGRFVNPKKIQGKLSHNIMSRVTEYQSQRAFRLADKVYITQSDIRQVQLAKSAIRTGIKLLQQKAGLKDSDIKQILLAGAFGNYIRRESALRIGLLPDVSAERIHFVGNAASSGAQMILLSQHARQHACQLAKKIEYVEIAHEKDFTSIFANSMLF
jgi:uncharacterized 2Fe-2S/4Fe-4S cluster protein (DUF4445 family)